MKIKKESKRIEYGDKNWKFSEENAKLLWSGVPLSLFQSYELRGKSFLEMGSGYGIFLYCLSKKGASVSGIEIDNDAVVQSKKTMKALGIKADIRKGDVRSLPFKNDSFDIVFCNGVIEHFPESQQAINEGYRVLKKGGIAMFSVPARFSFFVPMKLAQKTIDRVFKTNLWKCGPEKSFTTWKFKKMLRNAGFDIKKFEINEIGKGGRFPIVSSTLRILDKPFVCTGLGGRFLYALCEK